MTDSLLTDAYWSERYRNQQTGWDTGMPTTPLKEYIDQLKDTAIQILIPGCGNAHEAFYLLEKGFSHITLLDIAAELAARLAAKLAGTPATVLHADFFHHQGQYDLILEQTFFCALDPAQRNAYVQQMHTLLKPGGKLVGVLFNREFEGGPPFGGNIAEYKKLFGSSFERCLTEPCYNSIPPRKDSEAFIIIQK
jgi:methyl halide transferase